MGAANHPLAELRAEHAPLAVEVEDGGEHEAVDPRIEGAQSVRDPLGKHREHAARKINTRAPRRRLDVEKASLRDVVGNIRDVDPQAVAVFRALHLDGVVEVLRRLSVDRDDAAVAKVAAAEKVLGRDLFRKQLRRRDDRLWKT